MSEVLSQSLESLVYKYSLIKPNKKKWTQYVNDIKIIIKISNLVFEETANYFLNDLFLIINNENLNLDETIDLKIFENLANIYSTIKKFEATFFLICEKKDMVINEINKSNFSFLLHKILNRKNRFDK